jgi:hypothetical protein
MKLLNLTTFVDVDLKSDTKHHTTFNLKYWCYIDLINTYVSHDFAYKKWKYEVQYDKKCLTQCLRWDSYYGKMSILKGLREMLPPSLNIWAICQNHEN